MDLLPLELRTLYADLVQGVSFSGTPPGSIAVHTVKGIDYLYVTERQGTARRMRSLGRADDARVRRVADESRRAADDARQRRRIVAMLKRARVPAPSLESGRVLQALASAGLFRRGLVLVGTLAYQLYAPVVGVALSAAALTTQDADLATASLAVGSDTEGESLLAILQRGEPSFIAAPTLSRRAPPWRFRARSGLEVEVLTRIRRRADEEGLVAVPGLQCSAQPLRYLEYLVEEPIDAVALYGAGVPVRVPQPARYAVHKLIVAQVRQEARGKRAKDLVQARELLQALRATDPTAVDEALGDARRRGPKWRGAITRSLDELTA